MIQQSYHRRGKSLRGIGGTALAIMVLILGGLLVYQCIQWFRASNVANKKLNESLVTITPAISVPIVIDGTATIITIDGTKAGMVSRHGTTEKPEYVVTLTLPILAPNTSYGIWMLKDGLADVQSAGELEVRADGSFVKTFTIKDPLLYPNLVIMAEPNDGNTAPSGNIVAQGKFQ